ncbi:MAG: site-specific integrase [Candidatus Azobacteroides sp.]|nr:site-specific integrase [Candidatus Azobacteroides sp.]
MHKYTKEKVSVTSRLDKRFQNKEGKYPVKIEISHNRIRRYHGTGKDLSQEEWNELPKTKSKNLIKIRNEIKDSFDKVQNIVKTLIDEKEFTFEILFNRLGYSKGYINDAFQNKIDSDIEEKRGGNAQVYECALNNFEKYAGKNVSFKTITIDWLKKYENHIVITEGGSYNTVGMYARCIRHLMVKARENGIITKAEYPFGKEKYQIPSQDGKKKALDKETLKKIMDYDDGSEATANYRDLWIFLYLCNGMTMYDLLLLKFKNIDYEDKEISFFRIKTIRTAVTKKHIHAILLPEMETIINKWGNPDKKPNNYIFPYLVGYREDPIKEKNRVKDITRRVNRRMAKITKQLNLPHASTYSARHTFATVLKRKGIPTSFIGDSLGHTNSKTTEAYLADFEKETRLENANLLTDFA